MAEIERRIAGLLLAVAKLLPKNNRAFLALNV